MTHTHTGTHICRQIITACLLLLLLSPSPPRGQHIKGFVETEFHALFITHAFTHFSSFCVFPENAANKSKFNKEKFNDVLPCED